MNKTQKIFKTFILTLLISIVCICSTVFAVSEPIGSIDNPIPFKVGGDPITYKYTYQSTEGTTTKTLELTLLDQKKGAEAEEFVHANRENCLKSTSKTCWYLYKIRMSYLSSSEKEPTPFAGSQLLNSFCFYNTQKVQLLHPDAGSFYFAYTDDNFYERVYPNASSETSYIDFYYGIILENTTANDYPLIRICNFLDSKELSYVCTDPNYSVGKDINKTKIYGVKDKPYTGKARTQTITIKDGTYTLKKDVDYKLSYKNNINVGKATVTITGIGNYSGVCEQSFYITPPAPKSFIVSAQTSNSISLKWSSTSKAKGYHIYMYNPTTKIWVKVKTTSSNSTTINKDANKKDLIPCYGYKFRVFPYIYKQTSTTGKYTDTFTAYKEITAYTRPTYSNIKYTLPSKKTIYLTWTKSPRVSGYQVVVYKTKGLKNVAKIYYTKGTSMKISGLSSNKKYYVTVRPYLTINGKKLYSDQYYYYYTKIK